MTVTESIRFPRPAFPLPFLLVLKSFHENPLAECLDSLFTDHPGFPVSVFPNLTFFQLLELKAYDFKVFLRGTRPISGRVVIVAIDEPRLKGEGRWPCKAD